MASGWEICPILTMLLRRRGIRTGRFTNTKAFNMLCGAATELMGGNYGTTEGFGPLSEIMPTLVVNRGWLESHS